MYRDLNDYEILYMIKENDEDNYSLLHEKYKPLVYNIAKKYQPICKKYGNEIEDLMQIGFLALYEASKEYFSEKGAMFYTYVSRVVENKIIDEIRRNNTLSRRALNDSISYDSIAPNSCSSYIEMIADKKSDFATYDLIDDEKKFVMFKNTLPFESACVFELKYNGYTDMEIATLLERGLNLIRGHLKIIKSRNLYM